MQRVNASYTMFTHTIYKRKGLLLVENERRNFLICLLSNGDQFYTRFSQQNKKKPERDYINYTLQKKKMYSVFLATFPVPCFFFN